jgi:hypothetical protein
MRLIDHLWLCDRCFFVLRLTARVRTPGKPPKGRRCPDCRHPQMRLLHSATRG